MKKNQLLTQFLENSNMRNLQSYGTLHSIKAYKIHGAYRSQVSEILQTRFSIPALMREQFQTYFLLYWKAKHFIMLSENNEGVLTLDSVSYHIQYHRCNRGQILEKAHSNVQVALSFREAQPEYNLPAFVLVSLPPVS